jgi:hypothetical protein
LEPLNIVKSNPSGFPGIVTRYNDPEGGSGVPANVLEPVYENGEAFSVDIQLRSPVTTTEGVTYNVVTITELVSSIINIDGIRVTQKSSDTLNITGSPSNVFVDAYYEFIMKDRSIKRLPANTTEDFLSIVRWSPPSTKLLEDVPYKIKLKYKVLPDTTINEETLTILQDVYWDRATSTASFRKFVARGL